METFNRNCPTCGRILIYKNKYYLTRAIKNNKQCRICAQKNLAASRINPFYGKKHSAETKEKMKNCNKDMSFMQTKAYKDKVSINSSGSKNGMHGRTVYSIWLEKYGKEIADQKMVEFKKKQSINSSGERNPMYGKPAPQGSGNGWSGWYKGWYFRSLKELSFAYDLDQKGIYWQSAEKIKIKYIDYKGSERTYNPDFLVGNKIIEIKPIELQQSKIVKLKEEAAKLYCLQNDMVYEIIDLPSLLFEELKDLRNRKIIKFLDRYEKLFVERLNQEKLSLSTKL